ncbi:hypothetical protein BU15DRAFT_60114 [Melanogaster broomeanus]|nr:hypothetical protein BU15DRAFT_60114 [Melanogaster broomeanus]
MASTSTEMQGVQYVTGENSEYIVVDLLDDILLSSWHDGSIFTVTKSTVRPSIISLLFHLRKWDLTRVIFTLARYMTFAGAAMTTYACSYYPEIPKPPISTEASHMISIIAAEGLLIIRTFAFWNNNKKLLTFLLVFAALTTVQFSIAASVGLGYIIPKMSAPAPSSDPSEDDTYGCVFESARTNATQYGFLLIYELVLMGLTIYRRLRYYRDTNNPLVLKLYGDGLVYMSLILVTSFFNIIINLPPIPVRHMNIGSSQISISFYQGNIFRFDGCRLGFTSTYGRPLAKELLDYLWPRAEAFYLNDRFALSRVEPLHSSGSGGGPPGGCSANQAGDQTTDSVKILLGRHSSRLNSQVGECLL